MKIFLNILFFLLIGFSVFCQNDEYEFTRYFYPNGNISAEGYIREGKPDGYWKNYYEDGTLKSEGNRLFFELDSIWNFYYPDGLIENSINYRKDKKNGYSLHYKYFYDEDSVKHHYLFSKELFLNGLREGTSFYYSTDGKLQYIFSYKTDKKDGDAKEFNKDSTVITLFKYYNGYEVEAKKINRTDAQNRKQGTWIEFYTNGNKKTEYNYINDVLHGYHREYDVDGKMLTEQRYVNGELYVPELAQEEEIVLKAEIKKAYYPDGKIKFEGAFLEDKPVGIHKEYDEQGHVKIAKEYTSEGEFLGQGLFDNNGKRTGLWKLYDDFNSYYFGEGNYVDGKQDGKWIFYYKNGNVELEGYYSEGKPDREWIWTYENGATKRKENFIYGKREGEYAEYDSVGNLILAGQYFDDARKDEWIIYVGEIVQRGNYNLDEKTGIWKYHYIDNNKIRFVGNFKNNEPDGIHKWYYPNGNIEIYGTYRMGKKNKDWKKYNPDGSLLTTYTYRNDRLIKIDGVKLYRGRKK